MVPRWSPRLQSHRASVAEAGLSYPVWTNSDGRSIILMQRRAIDSRRAAPRLGAERRASSCFSDKRAPSPLPQRSPPCRALLSPRASAHKSPARSCVKPANATAYCAPVSLPSRQTTRQIRDRTISAREQRLCGSSLPSSREAEEEWKPTFFGKISRVFLAFPPPYPLSRAGVRYLSAEINDVIRRR